MSINSSRLHPAVIASTVQVIEVARSIRSEALAVLDELHAVQVCLDALLDLAEGVACRSHACVDIAAGVDDAVVLCDRGLVPVDGERSACAVRL